MGSKSLYVSFFIVFLFQRGVWKLQRLSPAPSGFSLFISCISKTFWRLGIFTGFNISHGLLPRSAGQYHVRLFCCLNISFRLITTALPLPHGSDNKFILHNRMLDLAWARVRERILLHDVGGLV